MLVLTRRLGEGITIAGQIRVVVLEVKAGQVRLGIEAPTAVPVYRDEVYARIVEENQRAAASELQSVEALKALKPLTPGMT
jgi:carbon storage regulator